ncbi:hypothetical protein [Haloarchaeobius sp. HME9146]|uniref:hypothetical protein n=1 Tax=Haloarchaeobius sp. HME9146 TaxID=2978732 RepID=UPI0021BE2BDF|nr:hypothetical protein [Haloarchaeobius sp. HME9146]MCT9095435.1 hypothetical protein [Haloarchaeobius sp. HME9146]
MAFGESLAALSLGVVDALVPATLAALVGFLVAAYALPTETALLFTALLTGIVFLGLTIHGYNRFRHERWLFPATKWLVGAVRGLRP